MGRSWQLLHFCDIHGPRMDQPQIFLEALEEFCRRGTLGAVELAGGSAPPGPLAFCVNFPSLVLVLQGRLVTELALKGRRGLKELNAGDALLVPANCWYAPEWSRHTTTLTVLFGIKNVGFSLLETGPRRNVPARIRKLHTAGPIQGIPQQLLNVLLLAAQDPAMTTALPSLANALVLTLKPMISSASASSHGRAYQLYESICLYLQKHGHDPNLSRDLVAAHFAVTPTHVSRLFQEQGTICFSDYLSLVRVARAKFLLVSYDQTLAQIAEACGFQDVGYFSRVFKKYARMTPGQYRLTYGR